MEDIPYEKRLAPHVIDIRAKHTPDRVFAVLPKGNTFDDGFFDLTYAKLAKAVDTAAWWFDEVLGGKEDGDGEFCAVPYVGPDDFRFIILMFGAYKSRRQFMMPLTMNTPEGLAKLLEARRCKVALASRSYGHVWEAAFAHMDGVRTIEVPELSFFLDADPQKPYPYTRLLDEALHDVILIVQTSGTTGTPKPIAVTGHFLQLFRDIWTESKCGPPDRKIVWPELLTDVYLPMLLPLTWSAGVLTSSLIPLALGAVPVLPPSPPLPMTPEYAHETTMRAPRGKRNGALFVPYLLRQLVADPEKLKALGRYDWVGFVGAPLDQATGDLVSNFTRVQSFSGASDVSPYPLLLDEPADWNLHRFHPMYGFHFQHFTDDLYELCVRRVPDEHRHVFMTNPDPNLKVYHTRDLFRAVPGREGFYTTAGRIDDFVKLASLTKFNAVNVERIIDGHPDVAGSLVAGDGRTKSFAIIQPSAVLHAQGLSEDDIKAITWPAVEEANKTIFGEARISKEYVIITAADQPIRRLGKGTVDRRNTLKLYEDQIEKLYQSINGV